MTRGSLGPPESVLLEVWTVKLDARHWSATLNAVAWFVFFVALIFRPDLVVRYPALAGVAIGGCIWWAILARRTKRRERKGPLDPKERP